MEDSQIDIVPLSTVHVQDAARLFADRYVETRARIPALPDRYADASLVEPLLLDLARNVPGVAALDDGRLLGYLIGQPIDAFNSAERGVYVPTWAHGCSRDGRRIIYEHMYEHLAQRWVEAGCFVHAIALYRDDVEANETWYELGFGVRVIDAVRSLEPILNRSNPEVTVRLATVDDIDRLMPLVAGLGRYLAGSPVLYPIFQKPSVDAYAAFISVPDQAIWLALVGNELVGYLRTQPPQSDVALVVHDPGTISVTGAFVTPEWRRHGVATALLRHVIDRARENGFHRCSVDFESQNLYGRRFWLSHFQPVCYSVVRRIDERVARAHQYRSPDSIW